MADKADIVKIIADESGISKKEATAAFDAFVGYLSKSSADNDKITIPGLGTVKVTTRKARTGRNPRTKTIRTRKPQVMKIGGRDEGELRALKMFIDDYKKL